MNDRVVKSAALMFIIAMVACLASPKRHGPCIDDAEKLVILSYAGGPFAWPSGKRAAVALTYDDALRSQLDVAAPALERHRLRATFFVTSQARADAERWRALAARGHELGSHTLRHPCDGRESWVPKGDALQDYDAARMQTELVESLELLRFLGQKQGPYTFAYPCGATWIGESHESYIPLVKKLFFAARGVTGIAADPANESFEQTPAVAGDKDGPSLISLVDENTRRGGFLVIVFHGVGGDYLSVAAAAHEALLAHLDEQRQTIWTGTFGTLAAYVQGHRPKP